MPLTRDFKGTVQARAQRDPLFREALMEEGIRCLLSGDVDTGRLVLRDYINATIGFEQLAVLTSKSTKSLMRMFGPGGNPQARNIFEVIHLIQQHEGVQLEVRAVRQAGMGDQGGRDGIQAYAKAIETLAGIEASTGRVD